MLQSFGISHVGRVRKNNEDCYAEDANLGLYAVADGMGGALAGERASQMTIETLEEELAKKGPDADLSDLTEAVQEANRRVRAEARSNPQYAGMGTTIVAVLIRDGKAYVANVGDSRLYKWSEGAFECVTSDHSWVNEVGRSIGLSDEELRTHAYRNMLTRAIGAEDHVETQELEIELKPDETLLLSSDGLHGVAEDAEIAKILSQNDSLEKAAQALVDSVLELGAPDNITAVLIRKSAD